MFDAIGLEQVVYHTFWLVCFLVSLGLHEYAHAWTAYKLGDPTPVLQGRLTPNPLKHIDIVGFVAIFLINFGWGKPVVTNPTYYKDPIKGDIITAFAGPAMNLLLAFFGMLFMMVYAKIVGMGIQDLLLMGGDLVVLFRQMFIIMNISLAVFNMIPLPPLDGYRLIKIFWKKGALWMEKNMTWFFIFLFLLMLSGSSVIGNYVSSVTDIIFRSFFMLFSLIFY